MIEVISLAWSGFYGGTIGNILVKWEQFGVFSYVLPFLMIFSLVFAILGRMKIFGEDKNKGVNLIIALAVSLMSLQFEFVPRFFAEVFPRVGVGLAIILVILILTGLFIDPSKPAIMYSLLAVGAVIVVVVLINTSGALGWGAGEWWYENWDVILGVVVFLVLIGMVIGGGEPKGGQSRPYQALGFH